MLQRCFALFLLLLSLAFPAQAVIGLNEVSETNFQVLTTTKNTVSHTPIKHTFDLTLKNSHGAYYRVEMKKYAHGPLGIEANDLPNVFTLRPNETKVLGRVTMHHANSLVFLADGSSKSNEVRMSLAMEAFWRVIFDQALPPEVSEQMDEIIFKVATKTAIGEEIEFLTSCRDLYFGITQFNLLRPDTSLFRIAKPFGEILLNPLVAKLVTKVYARNPRAVAKFASLTKSVTSAFLLLKAHKIIELELLTLIAPKVDTLTINATYGGPKPKVAITYQRVIEGNAGQKMARFAVSLLTPYWRKVEVGCVTHNETARENEDYLSVRKILVFNPGTLIQILEVPILGDTLIEPDERFRVKIQSQGYELAREYAVGIIQNDDGNVAPTPTPTPPPSSGGKIAFTFITDRNYGGYEISVMNSDGTNQTRLTTNTRDRNPIFSPDGNKITFTSKRDGNDEIYIMNADGTSQTRLTTNIGNDDWPVFLPNGNKIAFTSFRDGHYAIYTMNLDGTNQTRLINGTENDYHLAFSPDGSKIAFVSQRDGSPEVYVMNVDGTNLTQLTNDTEPHYHPVFSPDGGKIAFVSSRSGGSEIYVMNVDGSNQTRLTNGVAYDSAFSPDGSKIAFSSHRDGNYGIYIMNADGTNQKLLTYGFYPSWAPGSVPAPPAALKAPNPSAPAS